MITTAAHRIAHRYLYGDAFIRLTPVLVEIGAGGVVTVAELERMLGHHGIEAHDVVLDHEARDDANVFRWRAQGEHGREVMGRLVLHARCDATKVVVSAEIVLASEITASERENAKVRRVRVVLPDGGEIAAHDVERLLGVWGVHVYEVELHAGPTPKIVHWNGVGRNGEPVRGEVRARVDLGDGRAVVSGEIVISDRR